MAEGGACCSDYGIGEHCYIGEEVSIGNHVAIQHNVVIDCRAVIGDSTMIHSGVVIGTDGFGYYKLPSGEYGKVPHLGGVQIGSNVEIGANTCIDRGTIDDTVICDGVKIDNLCHIAHNVMIGENSLITALAMLAGSSTLKRDGYVAPCAAVMNQTTVGEHVLIGMGAVVTKDVEPNKVVAGVPARTLRENRD